MTTDVLNNEKQKIPFKLAVEELLTVVKKFTAFLEEETNALEEMNFTKVDSLQKEKRELAKEYENAVRSIADQQDQILTLDLSTRERLKQARDHFNTLLQLNMEVLERTKNSNKRLLDHILENARRTVADASKVNYSNMGRTATYKSAATSLTLDEDL